MTSPTEVRIRKKLAETGKYPPVCMLCSRQPAVVRLQDKVELGPAPEGLGLKVMRFLLGPLEQMHRMVSTAASSKLVEVCLVLCQDCRNGRTRAAYAPLVGIAVFAVTWFSAYYTFRNVSFLGKDPGEMAGGLLGIFFGLAVYLWLAYPFRVGCRSQDDEVIVLDLPNQEYSNLYESFVQQSGS